MRILMLTSRMDIGGAETHIYTLSKELVALGHEVFCASAGGATARALGAIGVAHFTLPLDKKTPDALFLSYRAIKNIIKKYGIDTVHAHSRIPAVLADRLKRSAARKNSSPFSFVTTAHLPFRTTPFLRKFSAWGDRCISVSEDIRDYLVCEYGIPPRRISVIENGIDMSRFHPSTPKEKQGARAMLGIDSRALVICSAQRSSESRAALPLFLSQKAELLLGHGEVLLLLLSGPVGDEPDLLEEIRAAADTVNAKLGRDAVVIVEGKHDVSPYLHASDIFVGVSRSAEEAMCCGIPVIIAGNDGYGGILNKENAPELLRANLTARGCEEGFSELLSDIKKLKNPRVRSFCSNFCLSIAQEHFSSKKMAEQTQLFYEEARKQTRNKSLLVIGHYGASNLGDDAACAILSEHFSEEYELHFVCKNKDALADVSDAPGIARTDLRRIVSTAKRSEAVIFGAGNLMQDDTSRRSLRYYKFLLGLVRRHTPKVAVFANGIGPIRSEKNEQVVCEMVGCADYISMRERVSADYAKRLTLRNDINVTSDIVYLAKEKLAQPTVAPAVLQMLKQKRYFVLCPRENTDKNALDAIISLAREACGQGLCALIVPMQHPTDVAVCEKLHAQLPASTVIPYRTDAPELLSLLSGADFCVGGRLHAGILSILAECAFVGYDSDERIKNNLAYAGVGAYVRSENLSKDTLVRALERQRALALAGSYGARAQTLTSLARRELSALEAFLLE